MKYGKRIKIGKKLRFRKSLIINIGRNGYLEIGDFCSFNNYCSINCHKKIIIGNNNMFGENVKKYDHNHIFSDRKINRKNTYKERCIKIGNNNWFASNVIILSKSKIENDNVFSAGVLVNEKYGNESIIKSNQINVNEKIYFKNSEDRI